MSAPRFAYPFVRRSEAFADMHFGKLICDPYRWLENPDSDETRQFISDQNALTKAYLAKRPLRGKVREKLTKLSEYNQRSCPLKRGNRYLFSCRSGLQNHGVLYLQNSLSGEPIKILDPNELSKKGLISLNVFNLSSDGNFLAFGLSENGSDWMKIRFKNLETNSMCSDELVNAKYNFGITWYGESSGIFYQGFPSFSGRTDGTDVKRTEHPKLYYHRLGTPQSSDTLIASFPDNPNWMIGCALSDCGNYLIMNLRQGVRDNQVLIADLTNKLWKDLDLNFQNIVTQFEADYTYITNDASVFYFCTNKEAPNYEVVSVELEKKNWKKVIPGHYQDVIDWVKCVNGNKLLICFMRHVNYFLQLRDLYSRAILQEFPIENGSITAHFGERQHNDFFIEVENFVTPNQVYRVDLNKKKPKLMSFYPKDPLPIDPDLFVTKQIFYTSKDGTKIPMFITHKKKLKVGVNTPCLLYGYGGYGVSVRSKYSPKNIVFMKNCNGIYAVAHIRGGGEYGTNWHSGGRLLNKQNCFDDFIEAATYLITNKMTSAKKLTIQGMSNGGLLVGACINQRPDLFGAAIAEVGIMDMLRYHKFTVGSFWRNEFGDPESRLHFENLLKISPLHNVNGEIEAPSYPAVLLLASTSDDRVVPSHSFKFISELQYRHGLRPNQENPLIIRIQDKSGHGIGKPLQIQVDEHTDILLFLIQSMDLKLLK